MHLSLRSQLLEFTAPEDPSQLKTLEDCLAKIFTAPLSQEDKAALLEVFERYPEDDGFGVFWSIVHGLEHVNTYETELVASVRRCPNLFNTLMLNRMLNAGITTAAGESIDKLFREVLAHHSASASVAKQVQGFLTRREALQ